MGREGGDWEQTTGDTATQLCYTFPQKTNQKFHLFKETQFFQNIKKQLLNESDESMWSDYAQHWAAKKLKSGLCVSMAAQIKIPCWMILSQALGWEMPLFGAPKLPFPSPVNNGHATTEASWDLLALKPSEMKIWLEKGKSWASWWHCQETAHNISVLWNDHRALQSTVGQRSDHVARIVHNRRKTDLNTWSKSASAHFESEWGSHTIPTSTCSTHLCVCNITFSSVNWEGPDIQEWCLASSSRWDWSAWNTVVNIFNQWTVWRAQISSI